VSIQRRLPWLRDADDREILRGRRALVLGAGPVGLLAAMLLRLRQCEVTVYSREEEGSNRGALVREIGATYISARDVPVDALAERIGGIELVYEAAGAPALTLAVVERMGPNGVLILTGGTAGGGGLEVRADALINRMVGGNLVRAGTVKVSYDGDTAAVEDRAALDAAWPQALRPTISERCPMEAFAERARNRTGSK